MEMATQDLLEYTKSNTLITPLEAIQIIKQILSAVKYLHSLNINHNNLKMENILMFSNNTCKLCDFTYSQKDKYYNKKE